eukprot:tig00020816_g14149.t1
MLYAEGEDELAEASAAALELAVDVAQDRGAGPGPADGPSSKSPSGAELPPLQLHVAVAAGRFWALTLGGRSGRSSSARRAPLARPELCVVGAPLQRLAPALRFAQAGEVSAAPRSPASRAPSTRSGRCGRTGLAARARLLPRPAPRRQAPFLAPLRPAPAGPNSPQSPAMSALSLSFRRRGDGSPEGARPSVRSVSRAAPSIGSIGRSRSAAPAAAARRRSSRAAGAAGGAGRGAESGPASPPLSGSDGSRGGDLGFSSASDDDEGVGVVQVPAPAPAPAPRPSPPPLLFPLYMAAADAALLPLLAPDVALALEAGDRWHSEA